MSHSNSTHKRGSPFPLPAAGYEAKLGVENKKLGPGCLCEPCETEQGWGANPELRQAPGLAMALSQGLLET